MATWNLGNHLSSILYDVRTMTKLPTDAFFQNVSPSLSDACMYKRVDSLASKSERMNRKSVQLDSLLAGQFTVPLSKVLGIVDTASK